VVLADAKGSKARASGVGVIGGRSEGGGGEAGRKAEGALNPGLASRVVCHVERDSGRFVVWHVEAATVPWFSPNYKTNATHSVIIQLVHAYLVPPLIHHVLGLLFYFSTPLFFFSHFSMYFVYVRSVEAVVY